MNTSLGDKELKLALVDALTYFPGINPRDEQIECLKSLIMLNNEYVLGVLPTGYGKRFIYQILSKLLSSAYKNKFGKEKTRFIPMTTVDHALISLFFLEQNGRLKFTFDPNSKHVCTVEFDEFSTRKTKVRILI